MCKIFASFPFSASPATCIPLILFIQNIENKQRCNQINFMMSCGVASQDVALCLPRQADCPNKIWITCFAYKNMAHCVHSACLMHFLWRIFSHSAFIFCQKSILFEISLFRSVSGCGQKFSFSVGARCWFHPNKFMLILFYVFFPQWFSVPGWGESNCMRDCRAASGFNSLFFNVTHALLIFCVWQKFTHLFSF